MSLINDLLEKPPTFSAVSKYTAMNGVALPSRVQGGRPRRKGL